MSVGGGILHSEQMICVLSHIPQLTQVVNMEKDGDLLLNQWHLSAEVWRQCLRNASHDSQVEHFCKAIVKEENSAIYDTMTNWFLEQQDECWSLYRKLISATDEDVMEKDYESPYLHPQQMICLLSYVEPLARVFHVEREVTACSSDDLEGDTNGTDAASNNSLVSQEAWRECLASVGPAGNGGDNSETNRARVEWLCRRWVKEENASAYEALVHWLLARHQLLSKLHTDFINASLAALKRAEMNQAKEQENLLSRDTSHEDMLRQSIAELDMHFGYMAARVGGVSQTTTSNSIVISNNNNRISVQPPVKKRRGRPPRRPQLPEPQRMVTQISVVKREDDFLPPMRVSEPFHLPMSMDGDNNLIRRSNRRRRRKTFSVTSSTRSGSLGGGLERVEHEEHLVEEEELIPPATSSSAESSFTPTRLFQCSYPLCSKAFSTLQAVRVHEVCHRRHSNKFLALPAPAASTAATSVTTPMPSRPSVSESSSTVSATCPFCLKKFCNWNYVKTRHRDLCPMRPE